MTSKEFNRAKGAQGERVGEDYLKKQGYEILERNVHSPFGEIDLVANHRGALVFIEVKTRRDNTFGSPEEAVDRRKNERLTRLASWYLAQHPGAQPSVRFDVLAIQREGRDHGIRLIQNAFEL